jgi:hypothetical protein
MSRAKHLIKLLERLIKQDHLYSDEQLKEMKSNLRIAKQELAKFNMQKHQKDLENETN